MGAQGASPTRQVREPLMMRILSDTIQSRLILRWLSSQSRNARRAVLPRHSSGCAICALPWRRTAAAAVLVSISVANLGGCQSGCDGTRLPPGSAQMSLSAVVFAWDPDGQLQPGDAGLGRRSLQWTSRRAPAGGSRHRAGRSRRAGPGDRRAAPRRAPGSAGRRPGCAAPWGMMPQSCR